MTSIRRATPEDAPFLQEMLAVAADWRPGTPLRPVAEILEHPHLARYVAAWPAVGDVGFVAEEVANDGDERPLGAVWWRFLPADSPGYGFVGETVPEVSIGVVAEARDRGLGTQLLEALIDEARQQALPALSLSVEIDNPATRLYERVGFAPVGRVGGSATMLLSLSR
ncbi:MAG: GNAT family N-acetyltransferase [Acidimicrobiales bacterium]